MWLAEEIEIDLHDAEGGNPPIGLIRITTPVGCMDLLGTVRVSGDTLHIGEAHVGGLYPGACKRAGLNAIGRKLLEVADVKKIIIQGSTRTTGAKPRQIPKRIVFPRR